MANTESSIAVKSLPQWEPLENCLPHLWKTETSACICCCYFRAGKAVWNESPLSTVWCVNELSPNWFQITSLAFISYNSVLHQMLPVAYTKGFRVSILCHLWKTRLQYGVRGTNITYYVCGWFTSGKRNRLRKIVEIFLVVKLNVDLVMRGSDLHTAIQFVAECVRFAVRYKTCYIVKFHNCKTSRPI